METDFTPAFEEYLARIRQPGALLQEYGLRVELDSSDRLHVQITFKRGNRYCCAELGCHLGPSWTRLREVLLQHGANLASPLILNVSATVESGAILEANSLLELPLESEGYSYEQEYREPESQQPSVFQRTGGPPSRDGG